MRAGFPVQGMTIIYFYSREKAETKQQDLFLNFSAVPASATKMCYFIKKWSSSFNSLNHKKQKSLNFSQTVLDQNLKLNLHSPLDYENLEASPLIPQWEICYKWEIVRSYDQCILGILRSPDVVAVICYHNLTPLDIRQSKYLLDIWWSEFSTSGSFQEWDSEPPTDLCRWCGKKESQTYHPIVFPSENILLLSFDPSQVQTACCTVKMEQM